MRFEDRVIDEVASLNDIVEVVSGYIPLKRSGRTFKALCPFHQEKTPSFIVHPEKQIFHCFGCGTGGNVFSFLMKFENLTFPEALRNLAGKVNFPLPEPTSRSTEEVSESVALYEIYRLAHEYYSENLKDKIKGEAARNYLAKRGFDESIWKEFSLGWATADWRGLFEFLVRRRMKEAILFRSGLVLRSREGGNPYDLFRGRLLFPIFNLQGKVIAFGGRGLGDEMPKYLNSPESAIFRKRRELYGLHLSKRFLSATEPRILIVEGYFDFLRVYGSGFKNVAATLGTSLSEDHVRVLKRFVQEAVVVYDGDQAGESAALRGLEVFLEGEMSVKVVTLPQGKDPDSLIKEELAASFQKLLDEAQDFFDFKWKILTRRFSPADSAGLLKLSSEFLETFSKVKNPILLDRYLRKLAGLLGIGEATLRAKLSEMKEKIRLKEPTPAPSSSPAGTVMSAFPEEGTLVALLLEEPSFWEKGAEDLSLENFRHPLAREALQILRENYKREPALPYRALLNRFEDESTKSFLIAHSMGELAIKEKEKAFSDCLRKIKQRQVQEKLEKLRKAITHAEASGEKTKVTDLLEEYRSLLEQKG